MRRSAVICILEGFQGILKGKKVERGDGAGGGSDCGIGCLWSHIKGELQSVLRMSSSRLNFCLWRPARKYFRNVHEKSSGLGPKYYLQRLAKITQNIYSRAEAFEPSETTVLLQCLYSKAEEHDTMFFLL